ncbi:MAG: DUF3990 domain-containing protein, partial [Erysipelotrichaceae bacterium]|nr:DUF3990 domain-containing protein [Erysipelotrichaceae bacterium]
MKLYHTGKTEIRNPDVHYGRKNADFGQGFYLTPDVDFAYRWAVDDAVLNEYELDETGLLIKLFSRDEQWFEYIFNNRRNRDSIEADVIIGPIANDTNHHRNLPRLGGSHAPLRGKSPASAPQAPAYRRPPS